MENYKFEITNIHDLLGLYQPGFDLFVVEKNTGKYAAIVSKKYFYDLEDLPSEYALIGHIDRPFEPDPIHDKRMDPEMESAAQKWLYGKLIDHTYDDHGHFGIDAVAAFYDLRQH